MGSGDESGGARARETARVHAIYQRWASRYDRRIRLLERLLFAEGRRWIGAEATGVVLEVALGTGRNLAEYAPAVRLTGVELSPAMLALARQRAAALGRDIALVVGDAQALPLADASFDSVVITLALCTIPDERAALREAFRVLRPGGRLLLFEHVGSRVPPVRLLQWLLAPLSLRLSADHLLREPLEAVRAAGFAVECRQRAKWGIVERLAARKPPER